MTREDVLRCIDAYIDGELQESEVREVEKVLAQDPDLNAWVRRYARDDATVRRAYRQVTPDVQALRQDVLSRISPTRPSVSGGWKRFFLAPRPSFAFGVAGLVLGLLATSLVMVYRQQQSQVTSVVLGGIDSTAYVADHRQCIERIIRNAAQGGHEGSDPQVLLAHFAGNQEAMTALCSVAERGFRYRGSVECVFPGGERMAHMVYARADTNDVVSLFVGARNDTGCGCGARDCSPCPAMRKNCSGCTLLGGWTGQVRIVMVYTGSDSESEAFYRVAFARLREAFEKTTVAASWANPLNGRSRSRETSV